MHSTLRHVHEIAGASLNGGRAIRPKLHLQRASEDIDRRLVPAMVMPARHHADLGVNNPDHMRSVAKASWRSIPGVDGPG